MQCPYCKKEISKKAIASHIGSFKSEKKAMAARENGKKNISINPKYQVIDGESYVMKEGVIMKIKKGTKSVNPKPVICVVK